MAKRLMAKTGTYQKDGQEKGEYAKVGVILSNDNGEYMLLDPSVSLAGVLAKQNVLAINNGKPARDSVMISIFEDDQSGQQNAPAPQQHGNAPQQQYAPQQHAAPAYQQQQSPQQQLQNGPAYQQQPPQPQQYNGG